MASTQEHDVHISASTADLRAAADRLKSDEGARQQLQQDPIGYLSGIGIHLRGTTADAVRQRGSQVAASARQAGIIHIDV